MIFKIRQRWVYQDVKGMRWKFISEAEARAAEAEDIGEPILEDLVLDEDLEEKEWEFDGSIT